VTRHAGALSRSLSGIATDATIALPASGRCRYSSGVGETKQEGGTVRKVLLLAALCSLAVLGAVHEPRARAADGGKLGPRLAASCLYTHSSEDDPIFNPAPGEGHSHDFYGNRSTNQQSTNASLREAGQASRCKQPGDASAQWVPQATWGGDPVRSGRAVIYYEVTPGMPRGFRPRF
jgi:hypothetical protein